jgi:hypothetical protein
LRPRCSVRAAVSRRPASAARSLASAPLRLTRSSGGTKRSTCGEQRCAKVANRNVRVWQGATENGP